MDSTAMSIFADNLRRLRTAAGLTQVELADASGISRTTIADYERGGTKNVELKTIAALAGALKCPPEDLVRALPSGFVVVAELLAGYLERWEKIDAPTIEEVEWLRGLPPSFWFGGEATPDSVHDLIVHYRKRRATPQV